MSHLTLPTNLPWLRTLEQIVLPNWQSALGFIMAFAVGMTMLKQRRRQSNIIAWTFFTLLFPVIGLLSFLLFGGRKLRRTAATKRTINRIAGIITRSGGGPPTPSAPEGGNGITLLDDKDGIATWKALCAEIAAAKTSIHITTYLLGHDETGTEIVRLLSARAREGVQVRLLVDALGSLGVRWRLCDPLIKAGGHVCRFLPVIPFPRQGSANLRNHRKMAVFDGQTAIVGGQNLALEYIGPAPHKGRFRDFSARISGPAVAELTRIFLSDWCFASGESPERHREQLRFRPEPAGAVRIEIVSSGPDEPDDPLWERFIALIQECRKEVTLITPYFVPDETLFRSLLLKIRSGRKVRLILPARSDHPFLDLARRPYLRVLHKAGADVRFHQKRMLHGKLFIVDNSIGVIGSANLDMRSLFVNFEVATFVYSPNTMRRFRLLSESIAAETLPYAGSKMEARNWRNRALEALAHMVGPLL
ncbi:MAG: phospholipase D-like domain-containing protein [Puniceicoccales bacterium]|nr:phospholipase D-like domain-containing protein [Puniceicoccales bacterium]